MLAIERPAMTVTVPGTAAAEVRDAERRLVDRAQGGDREAFRQLVERHRENVYRLAFGLLGDATDAEDATQEAFVRAYRSLDRFRGEARLGSWLYRVTTNVARDMRRRRRTRREETLDPALDLADAGDGDPDRRARDRRVRADVARALDVLSPTERAVFVLRHGHELSTREVAAALDRAEGTVKNLLFRALRKLRRELAPTYRPRETKPGATP